MAGVHGVGIRVVADSRQGFAWTGSLEPDLVDDALAEARDNVAFGQPDEWYGLASGADFVDHGAPGLDLWRDDLLSVTADDKVLIALELEKATRAADARVRGVEAAGYGDAADRVGDCELARRGRAVAPHRVLRVRGRDGRRRRGDADRLRVLGWPHDRRPGPRVDPARRLGARRETPGSDAAAHEAAPGDPRSARDALVPRRAECRVQRRVGAEGALLLRRTRGRGGRVRRRRAGRRPDRRPGSGSVDARQRGRTGATQRPGGRRRAVRLPGEHLHGSTVRSGLDRVGGPGRVQVDARGRGEGVEAGAGSALARRGDGVGARGAVRAVGERAALGNEPDQRRLLGRRRGPDGARRRSGRTGAGRSRSPRRFRGCCATSSRSVRTSPSSPVPSPVRPCSSPR